MPNYVRNTLVIHGHNDHVESVLKSIQSENEDGQKVAMDFSKFLPMPPELKNVTSPINIISEKKYKEQQKRIASGETLFRTDITKKMYNDYMQRFGAADWYEWQYNNWGVKWGAIESEQVSAIGIDGNFCEITIEFQTAWSCAHVVIRKLSETYPSVKFTLMFADEDVGSNCGTLVLKGGFDTKETYIPENGSDDAMEMYFKLWGGEENWVKNKKGDWEYILEW